MRTLGLIERNVDRLMPALLRPLWERLRGSQLAYRMMHGTFWSSLGSGGTQLMMLATSIVAARLLGKQQFGQYGVLMTTLGMFGVVAGFGIGATATRYISKFRVTDRERAGRIIGLSRLVAGVTGGLATMALFLAAPQLADRILAAPDLAPLLQLGSLQVLLSALNGAQYGILAGFEAFYGIARLSVLSAIFLFLLVVAGIVWHGLYGAVLGQLLAIACGLLLGEWVLRSEMRRHAIVCSYRGSGVERHILFDFSLPAVLSGIMVTPITWSAIAVMVNQPGGYAEMGLFNAANAWQKVILFVPGCLGSVALPLLTNLYASDAGQGFRRTLEYQLWINALLAAVPALLIALSSGLILAGYGPAFRSGWPVLVVLAFAAVPNAVAAAMGTALASIGTMWPGVFLNAVWGGLLISAAWLFSGWGALGLATAYACAYSFHLLFSLLVIRYCLLRLERQGGRIL